MSARYRWIAGGVALLLVLLAVGAALLNTPKGGSTGTDITASLDDGASGSDLGEPAPSVGTPSTPTEGDSSAVSSSSSSRITTARSGTRRTPPTVKDTPTPPKPSSPAKPGTGTPTDPGTGTPTDPGTGTPTDPGMGTPTDPGTGTPTDPDDDDLTEEERAYLEETREVVESNEASLRAAADEILDAITGRDAATLSDRLAADEGPQPGYITELITRYPSIIDARPSSTVNVFAVGEATTYFTYVVVRWQDAGITSEHTISIPLRYVDGAWHLTSLDESAEGLTFVQAVQL